MKKILLLFCFFFALGTAVQAQTSSKVDVRNTEGSTETIYSDISFGNVSDVIPTSGRGPSPADIATLVAELELDITNLQALLASESIESNQYAKINAQIARRQAQINELGGN